MIQPIHVPVNKLDNREKLAGEGIYMADLKWEGMLFAKTLRSERARARIRRIELPALPPGYFVVDRRDLPGLNRVKILINDQPFFAEDQVNYFGEPILLVVGEDKQRILELIAAIRVDYEDLDPILTLDEADDASKPPIFGTRNYFADYQFSRGEPERIFQEAERIVTAEYRTGYQEHVYLEPQGVTGVYEDGKMTVYGSIQCPYYVKNALVQALGWEEDRVRVVQTTTGGAFGGKEDYPSLLAGQVAAAALKTRRPVQLILERGEDLEATTKRHPSLIRLRTALDGNGRILALDADIRLNAGAYAGLSNVVLQRALFNAAGVYRVPHLSARGRAVATNTVPCGAFRGFGAPQVVFAIEMHLEAIARQLGREPLEYKMAHMAGQGDLTATGGVYKHPVKLPELIETVAGMSEYRRKRAEYARSNSYRGIGISLFLHGCGFTGSGERDHIKATAKLHKLGDGRVEILVANVDMGQGLGTVFPKIVARVLDLPLEKVIFKNPDTDRVPDSGPTVASRSVMIVGKLLEEAAKKLKQRWNEAAEVEVTEHYQHPAEIRWDDATFYGDAYPAYSWGVNAVEAAVDPVTLEITVEKVWAAFDVGRAMDERIIQGQIEGGMVQGLGYGSIEVMDCSQGRIRQRTVTDYIIPTAVDFPEIESRLVENPYERGPFGAKGAGELTLIGAAPALAAAVSQALKTPVRQLPIAPEYLMEVCENGPNA